jgi:hypothetical protein
MSYLHFKREDITYFEIGQPADYYYDLELNPLDNFPCDDILEKTRLLYALWELFVSVDIDKQNRDLSNSLVADLRKYFEQYDAPDFAYWALLHYKTIHSDELGWCSYEIEDVTNNLILHGVEIKLFIPPPYDNVIDEDGNDVDKIIGSSAESLSFSQNEDFPVLFMSDQQLEESKMNVNKYYEEIFSIFRKHNMKLTKCEDMLKIYRKIAYQSS